MNNCATSRSSDCDLLRILALAQVLVNALLWKQHSMKKTFTILYLMSITLIGTAQTDSHTKTYDVDEFNKIVIDGGGNLQIHYSNKQTLNVKSSVACDEMVDVSVSSKTLYIRVNDSGANRCAITIDVGAHSIVELIQNGGGNVFVRKGFNPQDSFRCEINGGGNMDVSELSVNSFVASIEGGGVILLNAENELTGSISGGGLIKYTGNPKVVSTVSGGGSVDRK
jgi:hypothetical protein